jgi:hypothetical protein
MATRKRRAPLPNKWEIKDLGGATDVGMGSQVSGAVALANLSAHTFAI